MPDLEGRRPAPWPDHDEDFRTHDNAASWWLLVLSVPLFIAGAVLAVMWVL